MIRISTARDLVARSGARSRDNAILHLGHTRVAIALLSRSAPSATHIEASSTSAYGPAAGVENEGAKAGIAKAKSSTAPRLTLQTISELSKARLSGLVVMTTGAGFLMAGFPIAWDALASATVGTALAACSANTLNQMYEKNSDKLMKRTQMRPLPSGRVSMGQAAAWAIGSGTASTAILALGCNPLTAGLGALNIALYAGVYTPLKRRSEINTWIGSVVGAIPPLMGYAAATGTIVSPEAALAASILYCWQFPHFFALAWKLRKDYARGGHQMVPVNDPTGQRTAALIMKYTAYLAPLPAIAYCGGVTSAMFAVEGTAINAYCLYLARQFLKDPVVANSKKVFLTSLWYLPVLLGLMVFHQTEKSTITDEARNPALLHGDKSNQSWLQEKYEEARRRLRGVCVHEMLFGKEPSPVKISADGLCPAVVGEEIAEAVEEAANEALENAVAVKRKHTVSVL